jgi:hypothetical protein
MISVCRNIFPWPHVLNMFLFIFHGSFDFALRIVPSLICRRFGVKFFLTQIEGNVFVEVLCAKLCCDCCNEAISIPNYVAVLRNIVVLPVIYIKLHHQNE